MSKEVKEVKEIKEVDKNSKSAFDLYQDWIDWYQRTAKYWGIDIYRPDYKITFMAVFGFLITLSYFINSAYLFYINLNVDPEELLKSICFTGTSVQGMAKIWTVVVHRDEIKDCHNTVTELTKSSKGEMEKKLKKLNSYVMVCGRGLFALYQGTIVALSMNPIYQLTTSGKKEPVVYFFIPFIDGQTNVGYVCNIMSQYLHTINAAAYFALFDNIFFYYSFFAAAFAEFVEDDCKMLTEAILQAESKLERNDVQAQRHCRTLLINAIKRNQKMDQYFAKLDFFQKGLLLHIGCIYYSLMICMFVAKVANFTGIYLFTSCYLMQLTLFSVIGTYIESKYDNLPEVIYDIPWYHLNIKDQKLLKFFLQHSQDVKKMIIMGNSSLNVETGLAILKSIYSAYVMLDSIY